MTISMAIRPDRVLSASTILPCGIVTTMNQIRTHHDEPNPHSHLPKDGDRPVPAEHDDCPICKYLSNKSLSAPTVAVVQLVEQVIPFEPLPLAQPSDVFLAGYDCRGPPSVG